MAAQVASSQEQKRFLKNREKREERRKQTAEDFTPSYLVDEILERLEKYSPGVFDSPEKTFIDPACGNGNILVRIVIKKLKAGIAPIDVAKTVFGLDIMDDNILEARARVLRTMMDSGEFPSDPLERRDIVLEVYKNIKRVDDTLAVDFGEAVFKRSGRVVGEESINRILGVVEKMNPESDNLKASIIKRRFIKEFFHSEEHLKAVGNLQNVHTPFDLTESIVTRLGGYVGLTDRKRVLTCNLEFIEPLLKKGFKKENITFLSGYPLKVEFARNVYGVVGIVDDFLGYKVGQKFDVVVGNPPYQAAKEKEIEGRG